MLLPIGHDETEVRRLPWVTLSLIALCLLVLFGTGTSSCDGSLPHWQAQVDAELARVEALEDEGVEVEPELPLSAYQKWGLVPAKLSLRDLVTHQFMHAGWVHLFFNMLLLYLLGPPIEDRWGRPVFLGLYLTGGAFAGIFFAATAAGSSVPLVGASGAVAAVMGAYLVRLYKSRLRYLYFLLRLGTFEAPAYLMLPLWFLGEVVSAKLSDGASGQGGVAYWAHVGGFLYGAAFAGAIKATRLEEGFLARKLEQKLVLAAGNPVVEEIQGLQQQGRFEEAYERLRKEMRCSPDDPEIVIATWDAASALRRPSEMAGVLGAQIERWVAGKELQTAADYWCELTLSIPDAETDPRILLVVAKTLHEQDRVLEARRALAAALRHGGSDLPPGLALRFFELARHRAPELATEVGRRALEWDQLPAERRRDLVNQLADMEDRREMNEESEMAPRKKGWRGLERRALEVELDPSLAEDPPRTSPPVPPQPDMEPDPTPPPGFDPEAQTQPRFESATPTDASPQSGPTPPTPPTETPAAGGSGPRFSEVKVSEVEPKSIDGDGLVLQRGEKIHRVPYSRIQAIGMGLVYLGASEPVLLIDLALNWNDPNAQILQLIRLASHPADFARLIPEEADSAAASRRLILELLERSGAVALPDAEALGGSEFSTYPDLSLYQNLVFDVR